MVNSQKVENKKKEYYKKQPQPVVLKKTNQGMNCAMTYVPSYSCYVKFVKQRYKEGQVYSQIRSYTTVRGEQMIMDFNKEGRVLGIELVGSPEAAKPCQQAKCTK